MTDGIAVTEDSAIAAPPPAAGDMPGARPTFDAERHRPRAAPFSTLVAAIFSSHWFWRLVRTVWPIPRVAGWALVSRYDDVAEVFSRHDVLRVPFSAEITRLNGGGPAGTPFILGMDDDAEHARQLRLVMQAFRHGDIPDVKVLAYKAASRQIQTCVRDGEIDAIQDLITAVPLAICQDYYGVAIAEPQTFAYATIAVSSHLFGVPPIQNDSPAANEAAAYIGAIVDDSVKREMDHPGTNDTIVRRLVDAHRTGALPLAEVSSFLIGMITGFVPTNTLAGGHILAVLFRHARHKDFMKRTRDAALTGDDALLGRHLFEALRFMPINPGRFRICEADTVIGGDSPRAARIRKGTKVLASTQSAMFDCLRIDSPRTFNADRDASDYMHFGYGLHWCAGVHIARAQITQTFKALLRHPGEIESRGLMERRGGFPDHFTLQFRKSHP